MTHGRMNTDAGGRPQARLGGLLRPRQVLLPTWRGWLALLAMGIAAMLAITREIHPFLALDQPVPGGDLVVEGWVHDDAFDRTVEEFRRNRYRTLYVTGGPLERGSVLIGYRTYAELGAAILQKKGLPAEAVQAVPAAQAATDRTYSSAVALRDWQRAHGVPRAAYHVMTVGPHARRTQLLFRQALGEEAVVGITAIADPNYDAARWWTTSAGVRTVLSEAIAYAYARLLFRPPDR